MADQFSKLLLIDNDTAFQEAFLRLCKKNHKKLSVANNAEQGMDLASRDRFDAIVMSVELPDKNGLSVCEHFKNSPKLRTIPVVMMSNQATGETLNFHKQLSVRADAYFLKADAHRAVTRESQRNS